MFISDGKNIVVSTYHLLRELVLISNHLSDGLGHNTDF